MKLTSLKLTNVPLKMLSCGLMITMMVNPELHAFTGSSFSLKKSANTSIKKSSSASSSTTSSTSSSGSGTSSGLTKLGTGTLTSPTTSTTIKTPLTFKPATTSPTIVVKPTIGKGLATNASKKGDSMSEDDMKKTCGSSVKSLKSSDFSSSSKFQQYQGLCKSVAGSKTLGTIKIATVKKDDSSKTINPVTRLNPTSKTLPDIKIGILNKKPDLVNKKPDTSKTSPPIIALPSSKIATVISRIPASTTLKSNTIKPLPLVQQRNVPVFAKIGLASINKASSGGDESKKSSASGESKGGVGSLAGGIKAQGGGVGIGGGIATVNGAGNSSTNSVSNLAGNTQLVSAEATSLVTSATANAKVALVYSPAGDHVLKMQKVEHDVDALKQQCDGVLLGLNTSNYDYNTIKSKLPVSDMEKVNSCCQMKEAYIAKTKKDQTNKLVEYQKEQIGDNPQKIKKLDEMKNMNMMELNFADKGEAAVESELSKIPATIPEPTYVDVTINNIKIKRLSAQSRAQLTTIKQVYTSIEEVSGDPDFGKKLFADIFRSKPQNQIKSVLIQHRARLNKIKDAAIIKNELKGLVNNTIRLPGEGARDYVPLQHTAETQLSDEYNKANKILSTIVPVCHSFKVHAAALNNQKKFSSLSVNQSVKQVPTSSGVGKAGGGPSPASIGGKGTKSGGGFKGLNKINIK